MDIKEVRIERIKRRMNELGLNSRELAKRSGISESGISRILTGEIEPRLKTFVKISDALKVEYVWLMGYDEEENNSDSEVDELVRCYKKLSPEDKSAVLKIIRAMSEVSDNE